MHQMQGKYIPLQSEDKDVNACMTTVKSRYTHCVLSPGEEARVISDPSCPELACHDPIVDVVVMVSMLSGGYSSGIGN